MDGLRRTIMAKTKSQKIIARNMQEVFDHPPSTLGKNQTATARRKQQVAIALSKSREAGADVPAKPRKKRGSKSSS